MENAWNSTNTTAKFQVTDLAKVCDSKDKAAVTKQFVKATSFILAAALGATKKSKVKREPLWDSKQFGLGKWFSQTAYLVVREIHADKILVENQYGDRMHVSRDILEKMDSANHFEKEVPMTMTELAEIL